MRYEYKFVEVAMKNTLKTKPGGTFETCKTMIMQQVEEGWRLKQVVTPFNEKTGIYSGTGYQIISEKAIGLQKLFRGNKPCL